MNRANGHFDLDSLTRADVAESLHDFFRLKTRRIESSRAHPVANFAHREGWTLDDLQTRGNIGMGPVLAI
ncbi:MAG: hypothetical protein IPK83_24980 [Planctomycetes bacterium]|nr:hypothetical protein [Planctomycetota bacterium]